MEYDKKEMMDRNANDRLSEQVRGLKNKRRLRAQFAAADDRDDFITMAGGDESRAFENFCRVMEKI